MSTVNSIATASPVSALSTATPVARSSNSGLASAAVTLSGEAGAIATLGGAAAGVQTYDAAGLLNAIAGAGAAGTPTTAPAAGGDTQAAEQAALDQNILAALPSTPAQSGVYTSGGALQSLPDAATSADWASVLSKQPSLAGTVIGDSFKQGIIATI